MVRRWQCRGGSPGRKPGLSGDRDTCSGRGRQEPVQSEANDHSTAVALFHRCIWGSKVRETERLTALISQESAELPTLDKVVPSPVWRVRPRDFPDEVGGNAMASIEIGGPAVKTRVESIEITDDTDITRYRVTECAHTSIIDGMAPGIVAAELQTEPRYTPAI